ncbi:MAG: hypothetical protein Q4G62_11125, partial [Pseudomonadota bacterium]|nr:hypothetical protein [Pseudomonadota bacterium]
MHTSPPPARHPPRLDDLCKSARLAALYMLLLLLAACKIPAAYSKYGAESYFEGPGLQLAVAAESGNVAEIHRLMKEEGVDPDHIFSKGQTPLLAWPILAENPEGLRAMLENGADPNASLPWVDQSGHKKGRRDDSPMVYAARAKDPIYLQLLLDHGGDPNARSANGESLLYQAFLRQNNWANIKLLIERGADINAGALSGGSHPPIAWYSGRGGFEYVYWLMEHGANPAYESQRVAEAPKGPDGNYLPQPNSPKQGFAPAHYLYDEHGEPVKIAVQPTVEEIYWFPTHPERYPELLEWQKLCQLWL